MIVTVFDCEADEAAVFRALSPHFDTEAVITEFSIREAVRHPNLLSRCISVGHKSRITASELYALHEAGVACISTRSIGFDHIDTDAAAQLGITVLNTAYSPDGVADYTLMLMLMAIRNMRSVLLRSAHNDFRLNTGRGRELRDMTVGIVGVGRIGHAVRARLSGFGCRILLCDPDSRTNGIPLCDLLKESDIVTLHVPLTNETRHMIGAEQICSMKRNAFLINTGRGALVDTQALIGALENEEIGGAALDVLEGEEGIFYYDHSQDALNHPYLSRLSAMPNVIVTPHTAYYTDHILYDTVEKTLMNCLNFERRQHDE